jgi:hypothetical protein
MDPERSKKLLELLAELEQSPEAQRLDREWSERMSKPLEVDGLRLVCTCGACPEQYDVFDGEKKVGYLRLRHGHFRCDYPDCGGDTIYQSDTKGDGIFDDDERMPELKRTVAAIGERMDNG